MRRVFATSMMLGVYVMLGTITGIIGLPYSLIVGNVRRLYRVGMWIVRAGVRAAGIRVTITGLENIPLGRSCIFMCNHVSNLDPTVLLPSIPGQCSVLLKKELMGIPILGTAMRMGGFIPVERGARPDRAQASVAAAVKALASGLHVVVFPEGTRSFDGRLLRFKKGPFFMAEQAGAAIVPVAIMGTGSLMRKGDALISPGPAKVEVLPVIEAKEYQSREALSAAVRASIVRALPPAMRPHESRA